jgi:hypothetical protein
MKLEDRVASALRIQTDLMQPKPLDLAVIRAGAQTERRRRTAMAVSASALVVAGVVGGVALVLDGPDRAPQPAKLEPRNGVIVHATERGRGGTSTAEVVSLPDASTAPYPAWNAFDQDSGRFLFTIEGGPHATGEDVRNVRVLAPGRDTPVADIACVQQCNWMASFGPGPDEVTVLVSPSDGGLPRSAQVWGFDGSLHDEIGLHDVVGNGRGIADLEWSPDGSRLAVSTFRGAWEPDCPADDAASCEAGIWLFDEAGGEPAWLHSLRAPPSAYIEKWDVLNPPMLTNLAWSPDGTRLGLISTTYYPVDAQLPTLVAIEVETGRTETLFEFAPVCAQCLPVRHGFAWSPDGTRVAVTNGLRIALMSAADGSVVDRSSGNGQAPLAWLAQAAD